MASQGEVLWYSNYKQSETEWKLWWQKASALIGFLGRMTKPSGMQQRGEREVIKSSRTKIREKIDDRRGEIGLLNKPEWQLLPLIHFLLHTPHLLWNYRAFELHAHSDCSMSAHRHKDNHRKVRPVSIHAVKTEETTEQTKNAHTHWSTCTNVNTITDERATGLLCQAHFTVAYQGQARQACGQPLLVPWVNTATSHAASHTHSLPPNPSHTCRLRD